MQTCAESAREVVNDELEVEIDDFRSLMKKKDIIKSQCLVFCNKKTQRTFCIEFTVPVFLS